MERRYCIEYVNPRYPLRDNGSINVRYNRVLTLKQAEHDLTLILSFGAKILNLYMGNVVDGKTGEWNPIPAIVDDDDWFTTDWLKSLNVWIAVEDKTLPMYEEVLAFNEGWIDEDKCPNGIRIGFLSDAGFTSATWNMEHDCYDTVYEQGDDYYKGNTYVIEEEKKKALPNMPTHYMIIPNYKEREEE